MHTIHQIPSSTETLTLPDVGLTLETWLEVETATQPEVPIRWCGAGVWVSSAEHLCVLISQLARPGQFGVVERRGAPFRWGQTMRHPGGFIFEVHDGSSGDYSSRVYRGEPGNYPESTGYRAAYPSSCGRRWRPPKASGCGCAPACCPTGAPVPVGTW